MQEIAAKRYSSALFEVGKERNKLDIFLDQMKDIALIFSNNKDFLELLNSPSIDDAEKKNLIEQIFKGKVEDEILDLILLLLENKRINEIGIVYSELKVLVYEYRGIKVAFVTTAVSMTDEEIEKLKDKLKKKYNKEIEIDNIIDPSVIGGVSLKIDDNVIDDTIKERIEKIRKNLIKGDI